MATLSCDGVFGRVNWRFIRGQMPYLEKALDKLESGDLEVGEGGSNAETHLSKGVGEAKAMSNESTVEDLMVDGDATTVRLSTYRLDRVCRISFIQFGAMIRMMEGMCLINTSISEPKCLWSLKASGVIQEARVVVVAVLRQGVLHYGPVVKCESVFF